MPPGIPARDEARRLAPLVHFNKGGFVMRAYPKSIAGSAQSPLRHPWRGAVVFLLVWFVAQPLLTSQAWAAKEDEESGTAQLLRGAASLVVGVPYTAIKLAFAGAGSILGGVTYVITAGDEKAAQKVWDSSLRGTYIITPDHLKGEKPVKFIGSVREDRRLAEAQ
jgi:hypothetical protein